jgi:hypothetical protein
MSVKKFRNAKLSPAGHRALKEISTLTGLKMWAALEQAIVVKLADVKTKAAQG